MCTDTPASLARLFFRMWINASTKRLLGSTGWQADISAGIGRWQDAHWTCNHGPFLLLRSALQSS
jgi:hypothetical protein